MRYYVIYSLLCAAFVIRGAEITKKPESKAKRSVLTSKFKPIHSYDDLIDNEGSLAKGNPWYFNPNSDSRPKMAPRVNDYQPADESLAKAKRDYQLYPLAKELYVLRNHPAFREVKNRDVRRMSPTSAILGFKAHLHHDVGDIGRSFVHRPTKKDLENEEYQNPLQLLDDADDQDVNQLPVQLLDDVDKVDRGPIRRQYSDLGYDESYLDKDQMEHYLAMNRKPLEFDKSFRRYFNSDRLDNLDYLDKYSKAMDRLGRNSLVLDDAANGGMSRDGADNGEVRSKSLAMAIEPLNGQLQQLVDSVQQINEQLREQEKREVKGKESRRKRQVSNDDCKDYLSVEADVKHPLEQTVTCTCYRVDETSPGGNTKPVPGDTSTTQVTTGIDAILGGIHSILPSTLNPETSTSCPVIQNVHVEEVMDAGGRTNCPYRFLRTNDVKLLEMLLPVVMIQNVTAEGVMVKVPNRRERFVSLEAGNIDESLKKLGKERRWGLKLKNRLRNADNKRWSIRLNLPGVEQLKNSVKRKAEEKQNDGELLNTYLEMLEKEEEQEMEDYEEGEKVKRSLEGNVEKKLSGSQSRVVKVGRRLMAVEEDEEEDNKENEEKKNEKKIPIGLAILKISDVTIPDPFDLMKKSESDKKNKTDKAKGKLSPLRIPGVHELAKVVKEKMKIKNTENTPSMEIPTVTIGDPVDILEEEVEKENAKQENGGNAKSSGSISVFEFMKSMEIPGPFELAKAVKARKEKENEIEKAASQELERSVRYKRFGKKDPTDYYMLDLTQTGDSDLGDFNLPGMSAVSNYIEDEPSTEYLAYTLPDFDVNKESDHSDLNSEQTTSMFMDDPTVSMLAIYLDTELAPEISKPWLETSILRHEDVETEDSNLPEVTEMIPSMRKTNPAVLETETSILLELEIGLLTGAPTNQTTVGTTMSSTISSTTEVIVGLTTENETAEFIECMSATESSTESTTTESTLGTNATETETTKTTETETTTPETNSTTETTSTTLMTTSTTVTTTKSRCKISKEELIKQREKLDKLIKDLVDKERKLDDEEDEARKLMRTWEDQRERCGFLWDLFFPRPPPRPRPTKPTKRPPTTIGMLSTMTTPVPPIEATKSTISKAEEEEEVTTASASQLTEIETFPTEESTSKTESPIFSTEFVSSRTSTSVTQQTSATEKSTTTEHFLSSITNNESSASVKESPSSILTTSINTPSSSSSQTTSETSENLTESTSEMVSTSIAQSSTIGSTVSSSSSFSTSVPTTSTGESLVTSTISEAAVSSTESSTYSSISTTESETELSTMQATSAIDEIESTTRGKAEGNFFWFPQTNLVTQTPSKPERLTKTTTLVSSTANAAESPTATAAEVSTDAENLTKSTPEILSSLDTESSTIEATKSSEQTETVASSSSSTSENITSSAVTSASSETSQSSKSVATSVSSPSSTQFSKSTSQQTTSPIASTPSVASTSSVSLTASTAAFNDTTLQMTGSPGTSTTGMAGSGDILEEKLEELEKEVNEREQEVGELENLLENQEEEFEKKTEELEDLIKASTVKKYTLPSDLESSSTPSPEGVQIKSEDSRYVYDPEEEVWREKLDIVDPEYNQTSMEYEDCTSTTLNSEAASQETRRERKLLAMPPNSVMESKGSDLTDKTIKLTVPSFMLKDNEWVNQDQDQNLPEPVIPTNFQGYTRVYQQWYKVPERSFTPRKLVTKQSYQEMSKMISDFENRRHPQPESGQAKPTISADKKPDYRRQKRNDDYYGDCDEDDDSDDDYEPEPIITQRAKKSRKHDSRVNLKKAEIAMLEDENDELIKKEQLLKQIQEALQISKHELRRVKSSILSNAMRKRAKRDIGLNGTSSSFVTETLNSSLVTESDTASGVIETSNSSHVFENSSTVGVFKTSNTFNISGTFGTSTTPMPSPTGLSSFPVTATNNTKDYVTRNSSYTVRVVHLVYDDDLEGHRVKLVSPSQEDLVIDEGLVTSKETIPSTTESTTETIEESTTSSTMCPPCGQTASMTWPTEAPDKYHIGGTQSWHKEVPVPCVPVIVEKRRSELGDGFVENLRNNLERQLEKSVLSGKNSWKFKFGPNSSDDRDLLKETIKEFNISKTETSTEFSVDALKRCLETSKNYRASKRYESDNDSISIVKLSGPELEESNELMSPSEFYCIYKYGFSHNGDTVPRRHLLAVNHGPVKSRSTGKSLKKTSKHRVSKKENKHKLKKSVGKKKKLGSQKSAKRSILDNIKRAFNHMIGNDATTSPPVRVAKQSFKPKPYRTKAYHVSSKLYGRKKDKTPEYRTLFRESVAKKPLRKHKYKKFWVKIDPKDVRPREIRESKEPELLNNKHDLHNDTKKIYAGVPSGLDSNKLGVTEKILIYMTRIKDSGNSSHVVKSKRHRKSTLGDLNFEDLYKDKNLNRLISSFADRVVKSVEGSSRSLRELDPRLRVKVMKGSSVYRNPEDFDSSDSEFTIDMSDMNADSDTKYLKRSDKNLVSRLVGKSARKMNLEDDFGKKRNNWIREVKRNEIVRKLRHRLLSELEKRMESEKIKDLKKNVEYDSTSFDKPIRRIDKLGEKFKIMYAMHNSPRQVIKSFRRKRNDASSLIEGVYFDNQKDKKLMKALIDQIFDVQRGVNTTLQIIKRRLASPSDFDSTRDRRLAKKSAKKVKKKAPKKKAKKSVGHKKKLKSRYDAGHVEELRNDIEQILKEDTKRKKRNLEGFKKRKILSVAYDYDEDDHFDNTEETKVKIRNVKIKFKDKQPTEVRKERSNKQKSRKRNLQANNDVDCVNCICDLEASILTFKSIVSERHNLLDRIASFKCKKFVDIGDKLELAPSRVIEEIYPAQKSLAQAKGLKYIQLTDLEKVLQAGEGVGRDHEILSFPGIDLVIPCNKEGGFNWMFSISKPNYTWTRQDDIPVSGTVHKNGNLELNSLSIQDAGNYSCTLTYVDPDNEEVVKHIYKHGIQVVTLPRYSLRGGNRYRVSNCDEEALEILATYLPQKFNGILCKRHLCDTFIFAPQCNYHEATIKVLVNLSSLSKTVPFLSKCGLRCHKAIQDKLILLLSQNLSTILTKNNCLKEDVKYWSPFPKPGSRERKTIIKFLPVALASGFWLAALQVMGLVLLIVLWTSPITLGTFSLIMIILVIGLILCITMSCVRKDKARDKCLIINNESRKPLISSRNSEDHAWRKKVDYKNAKSERPFVYGVDVISQRKKTKIEAKKKETSTCADSDSFDCPECKKLNSQNYGSKKNPRPPVPYPDFDN